jgi:hypothetical protein
MKTSDRIFGKTQFYRPFGLPKQTVENSQNAKKEFAICELLTPKTY